MGTEQFLTLQEWYGAVARAQADRGQGTVGAPFCSWWTSHCQESHLSQQTDKGFKFLVMPTSPINSRTQTSDFVYFLTQLQTSGGKKITALSCFSDSWNTQKDKKLKPTATAEVPVSNCWALASWTHGHLLFAWECCQKGSLLTEARSGGTDGGCQDTEAGARSWSAFHCVICVSLLQEEEGAVFFLLCEIFLSTQGRISLFLTS
jgi:hypothetical protein